MPVLGDFPDFAVAVGEEGSDPVVDRQGTDFRHDQFVQSGHVEHRTEDLRAVADLGVTVVRYGTPWRLAEPAPGEYDWSHWDRALAACDAAGLEPVIDLLHFGLPDHHPRFGDPAWVDAFVRYTEAFLARYRTPRWFTPVNEPGVTALLTARFGMWNDRLATAADHARVLALVTLANLEALARIRADRPSLWIGAEGFDAPVATTDDAVGDVEERRAVAQLVWDLHLGVDPEPPGEAYLAPVDDATRARLAALAVDDDLVAGHDFYPTAVQAVGGPSPGWSTPELVALGAAELVRWHDRYRVPFWIGETSNLSLPVSLQIPWLDALVAALDGLRADGLPVRGLCWYSRGDQFDWQTALINPTGAVTEVGLFDVDRKARPVAARFAALAADRRRSTRS